MKITNKQLNELLAEMAQYMNLATSKDEAISKGHSAYLQLDYAPVYGGYRLVFVNVSSGGHSGAFGRSASEARISAKEMYQYLNGLIAGYVYSIK